MSTALIAMVSNIHTVNFYKRERDRARERDRERERETERDTEMQRHSFTVEKQSERL